MASKCLTLHPLTWCWGQPRNDSYFSSIHTAFMTSVDTWASLLWTCYCSQQCTRSIFCCNLFFGFQFLSHFLPWPQFIHWTICQHTQFLYCLHMSHFVKPDTVGNYLSGICSQLEPFYLDIHQLCCHHLITKTLQGCKKLFVSWTNRKWPLTCTEIAGLLSIYNSSSASHDDKLFFSILTTGFHALLCLGELVWPDNERLQDFCKVIMHHSVEHW